MKRAVTFVLSALLLTSSALASGSPYGWTVSASSTDPYQNTTPFVSGFGTIYLWYACSTAEPTGPGGMSAAQFGVMADHPGNLLLAFDIKPPFLNAGGPGCPLLAVGACPPGPLLAANLLVIQNSPGTWCIGPCDKIEGTVDCGPNPSLWPMDWVGLDVGTGQTPCSSGDAMCQKPISIERTSWGQVKGMYR